MMANQNKKKYGKNYFLKRDQQGAVAVIVAVVLIVFIGFGALAVDLGFAYFQRNNLQNAVDAGALAGARVLYQDEGKTINPQDAINHAIDVAQQNTNGAGYQATVGHWSFGLGSLDKGFYPWTSQSDPQLVDITSYNEVQLDENQDFVNAVEVTAVIQSPSFFSRIWGNQGLSVRSQAVAYVGYAGTLDVLEVDVPISICGESIKWGSEKVDCGIGRLIHSGQSSGNSDFNTGAWNNYSSGCEINFNTGNSPPAGLQYLLKDLEYPECTAPNEAPIIFGAGISTGGGQSDVGFSEIGECTRFPSFVKNTDPREDPWEITVLVVDCDGANNPSGCLEVLGAVKMSIVLITDTFPSSENQKYNDVPYKMGHFESSESDGFKRWEKFVDAFELKVLNQTTKEHEAAYNHYYQKTIYALPDCEPVEPRGLSGGQNFGIMARVPVLVN